MPSTIVYTLRIVIPDEIDADTLAEDTTPQLKVGRYLGGFVDDAASQLSSWLPEGFYAKADQS